MLYGDTRRGTFPSDVKAAVQYGENLQSLAVALNTVGAVSIKRTHEILSGVFNIPIATGTISSMVKRCADSLSETVGKIKDKMIGSALGHFDETGIRVDKKLWWVHDASNCEYTYLDISPKRGSAGMEQCGVLPEFKGIAMHDCWASYWNYPDIQHAVCCALPGPRGCTANQASGPCRRLCHRIGLLQHRQRTSGRRAPDAEIARRIAQNARLSIHGAE